MPRFATVILAVSLVALTGCGRQQGTADTQPAPETKKTMMTLQQMEDMFVSMRAKTKWDVDGDMLWGYFFTDRDPKKLERASQHLTQAGYHLVRIYPTDDRSTHVLHVERIERHTPQTLQARNGEFERLASEFTLESYDGMDVGPVLTK